MCQDNSHPKIRRTAGVGRMIQRGRERNGYGIVMATDSDGKVGLRGGRQRDRLEGKENSGCSMNAMP